MNPFPRNLTAIVAVAAVVAGLAAVVALRPGAGRRVAPAGRAAGVVPKAAPTVPDSAPIEAVEVVTGAETHADADTVEISGRVTLSDGTPATGTLVMATGADGQPAAGTSVTLSAGDGAFALRVPRSAAAGVRAVMADRDGCAPAITPLSPVNTPGDAATAPAPPAPLASGWRGVVLVLAPSSSVAGVVVDGAGAPVAGAVVSAVRATGVGAAGRDQGPPLADAPTAAPALATVQRWETETGPDGRFELEGIPGGSVRVRATRGARAAAERPVSAPDANLRLTLADANAGAAVEGNAFRHGTGEAVPGATVTLVPEPPAVPAATPSDAGAGSIPALALAAAGATATGPPRTAVTGPLGEFQFSGLAPGAYRVQAATDELILRETGDPTGGGGAGGATRIEIPDSDTTVPLPLFLYPGHVIAGRVVEAADGRPVPGVEVSATGEHPAETVTGPDGTFRLTKVSGDRGTPWITLRLRKDGFLPWARDGSDGPTLLRLERETDDVSCTLQMVLMVEIAGRVVAKDGRPVGNAVVSEPGGLDARPAPPTGADGVFSLRVPAGRLREVTLTAKAPGFTAGGWTGVIDRDSTRGAEITLDAAASIAGVTVDESGTPLAGMYVVVNPRFDSTSSENGGSSQPPYGRSGPDGMFRVENIPPGAFAVDAQGSSRSLSSESARKYGNIDLARGQVMDGIRLVLLPMRELTGVVVDADNGRTLMGATVSAARTGGGGNRFWPTTTDDAGIFRLTDLPADDLRVMARSGNYQPSPEVLRPRGDTSPIRFELFPQREVTLVARVIDAVTSEPVTDFRVEEIEPAPPPDPSSAPTESAGPRITLEGGGVFTCRGVHTGSTYPFRIIAPGRHDPREGRRLAPYPKDPRAPATTVEDTIELEPGARKPRNI